MASSPKRDTHFIVLSIIVSLSLVLLLGLVILLFVQYPGPGTGPEGVTLTDQSALPRQEVDRDETAETASFGSESEGNTSTPAPFGTGAADDFESNDWEGGSGQWAEAGWEVSDGGGSRTPDLRLQDDGEIEPYRGEYMARVRHDGSIRRTVSLKDAKMPVLTFHWAYSGLEEDGNFRLEVNGRTEIKFDRSYPAYTWQEQKVDLSRFAGEEIEICFKINGEDRNDIGYIDDVQVRDTVAP